MIRTQTDEIVTRGNGDDTQAAAAVAEVTSRGNRGGDCGVVNCGVNSDDDEGQQRIILSTPARDCH